MFDETNETEITLSAMEYFLLALIQKAELTSLYAFQQGAGLQPGGIRSALQRLESLRLIARAESGARRRRDFSLTPGGVLYLNRTWRNCMREYPDGESVLRAAGVALLMDDPQYAGDYLNGLAIGRKLAAEEKSMEAERLGKTQKDSLSTYAWMRALSEARRRGAEGDAFSLLSQFLREKPQPDVVQPR